MPDLTVGQILDGSELGLTSGLADLLVLDFGGRLVMYALSRVENTLVEIEIAGDGTLTVVGLLGDLPPLESAFIG